MSRQVYVVEAVRTPVGRRKGSLSEVMPHELLTLVLKELVARAKVDPSLIEDVVVGCVTQSGEQGNNFGRMAALMAGLPITVPSVILNRKCGSSQQAIHFGAQEILSGDMECVIACGVENMTRVPIGADRFEGADELLLKQNIFHQGLAAEFVAEKWGISREELDELSLRSHTLAHQASEGGLFKPEIVPVALADGRVLEKDECIRPDTSLEKLATLKTSFKEGGVVTAGNSSQICDGAAALLLMSGEMVKALGIKPIACIKARTVVGSDPTLMLTGPIDATKKILQRTGLALNDIDVVEINEAFASMVVAWQREMSPDMNKVNPRGGSIALGHPTGASGARIAITLINEMKQNNWKYGLQTMCIAHGMATATIYENVN